MLWKCRKRINKIWMMPLCFECLMHTKTKTILYPLWTQCIRKLQYLFITFHVPQLHVTKFIPTCIHDHEMNHEWIMKHPAPAAEYTLVTVWLIMCCSGRFRDSWPQGMEPVKESLLGYTNRSYAAGLTLFYTSIIADPAGWVWKSVHWIKFKFIICHLFYDPKGITVLLTCSFYFRTGIFFFNFIIKFRLKNYNNETNSYSHVWTSKTLFLISIVGLISSNISFKQEGNLWLTMIDEISVMNSLNFIWGIVMELYHAFISISNPLMKQLSDELGYSNKYR